jgi:hypothetical protein
MFFGLAVGTAQAVPLTSPNFRLDPEVANSFGGTLNSTNYQLTDSGGEAVVGQSASASYKLGIGYVAELTQSIQLTLNPAVSVSIPDVTPGASQTATTIATVLTDAPGFDLAIHQDHDLRHTDTTTMISPIGPSIASPAAWSEGTTKGFGFTVSAGSQIEGGWGSSPNYNYAAIPGSATTFHSYDGFLGGASDATTITYRLDVNSSQKSGSYSNIVSYTATLKP